MHREVWIRVHSIALLLSQYLPPHATVDCVAFVGDCAWVGMLHGCCHSPLAGTDNWLHAFIASLCFCGFM